MPEDKTKAAPAKTAAAATSTSDDNLIGALCYVPIFLLSILVPLYIILTEKKQNKTLVFHAWQALALTFVLVVVFGIFGIIEVALTIFSSGIGAILSCLLIPLIFVVFVAMCFVAYKVYEGEKYVLPVIGDFAGKQAAKTA